MKPASENRAPQRATWLKQLHQWHWISSAVSLIGMMLFAFTGITLNHAADISSEPEVVQLQFQIPDAYRQELEPQANEASAAPLPPGILDWLNNQLDTALPAQAAEWSEDEIYLSLPRPGGDGWLRVERATGAVEYESTERGWVSYLNDLHKGRHTGVVWKWFLDIFSVACLVFAITGLLILKFHANTRVITWPLVGLGFVAPALLLILFVH